MPGDDTQCQSGSLALGIDDAGELDAFSHRISAFGNGYTSASPNLCRMMKRLTVLSTLAILAVLPLTGVAFAGSSTSSPTQWAIYGETTQPNGNLNFHPIGHGMMFAMPDATASSPTFVNYMLDTYTASLTESNTISATIEISASSGAVIMGNPLWTTEYGSPVTPAFVRLFFQSNLPSDGSAVCVSGNDNYGNYWWADVQSYTFSTGTGSEVTVTMSVSLSSSNWSGICGNAASSTPAFDNALANIKYVGLSFGSGYFFASGVGVDGLTGSATFQLLSYTIA